MFMSMDSDTLKLLLHLKQLSKPITSNLPTNLLYLLDAVCVCGALIQLYWYFLPGVEYGFLCVYNVMREL